MMESNNIRVASRSNDNPEDRKESDHRQDDKDAATPPDKERKRPENQVQEISKRLQGNKITNSLAGNNDRGSDETSSEHDYYELENCETEQEKMEKDLPKNKATARDYEIVIPSGNATET